MAIIPSDEKVIMVSGNANTTYSGSKALKETAEWYTMQDVTNTVRPYKVYTALLTQSGGSEVVNMKEGTLTVGVTYQIIFNTAGMDFTNVGAPNNNIGTFFVAIGTTPNSWGVGTKNKLSYNTGAPVVTVLENTIGNIWFTYNGVGDYRVQSNGLFIDNKTTFNINLTGDDLSTGYMCIGYMSDPNNLGILTGDIDIPRDNVLIWSTPIEIRVYN